MSWAVGTVHAYQLRGHRTYVYNRLNASELQYQLVKSHRSGRLLSFRVLVFIRCHGYVIYKLAVYFDLEPSMFT